MYFTEMLRLPEGRGEAHGTISRKIVKGKTEEKKR